MTHVTQHADRKTGEVGSHPNGASWIGAMDMSGNIAEFTNSLRERSYPLETNFEDLSDDVDSNRVLRGGILTLTTYNRNSLSPFIRGNTHVGFRCARDIGS